MDLQDSKESTESVDICLYPKTRMRKKEIAYKLASCTLNKLVTIDARIEGRREVIQN